MNSFGQVSLNENEPGVLKAEEYKRVFAGKITFTTYTCRYGPVSLDLSVVILQTTGPRDPPHRRGSESGYRIPRMSAYP